VPHPPAPPHQQGQPRNDGQHDDEDYQSDHDVVVEVDPLDQPLLGSQAQDCFVLVVRQPQNQHLALSVGLHSEVREFQDVRPALRLKRQLNWVVECVARQVFLDRAVLDPNRQ